MNFFERVFLICTLIPAGQVASYGQIAELAGNRRMARQVGWALNRAPEEKGVPAHRVVNREGILSGAGAFFLEGEQAARLEKEGIRLKCGKVDMEKYGWKPGEEVKSKILQRVSATES